MLIFFFMFSKYIVFAVPSVFFVNAVFLRVFHGLFLRKPHKDPVCCESGGMDYVPIVCLILCLSNGYNKDFSVEL